MSLRRALTNRALRLFEKRHLARTKAPADLRASFERKARVFLRGPSDATYSHDALGGVPGQVARAAGADETRAILYFHGGGYVMGSSRTHRGMLAHLSQRTGRVAYLPDYRLAPEHPFPAAFDDALAVYLALVERIGAGAIVIGGDSAGGGLALALLGEICRQGLPQPAGSFALSPLTDMSFSGDSLKENAEREVMLPISRVRDVEAMYLAGHDPRDPRLSPLFADFSGSAPVRLSVGDTEILRDDTLRMVDRMREQGVEVTLELARDLPHVWPMLHAFIPEARSSLGELADWIRAR